MSRLQASWSAFSPEIARAYLKGFGHPSLASKELVSDLLKKENRHLSLVELGCGNAQLAEHFFTRNVDCHYTGVDFSEPLLAVARATFAGDSRIRFVASDIQKLEFADKTFDFAVFSHVMELLNSPQRALQEASRIAKKILIRFYEPPVFDETTVELLDMDVGAGPQPYLRWKLGRDDYRLILNKIGARRVDVYHTVDKDQVHVLHFD